MALHLPARTPAGQQIGDPLYTLARRAGLVADSLSDQTDRLQWWLTQLVAQTHPVAKLEPGKYIVSDQLTIDNSNAAKPISVLGDGGQFGDSGAHCALYYANGTDPGDGKYAVEVTSQGGAPVVFGGIALIGSQDGNVKGRPQWACRGLHVNGRMRVFDVGVTGFHSGISIDGDHHHIHDCTLTGNSYNIEVPPGGTSQGDILIRKTQAGNATFAAIGVAQSSKIAGWRLEDVEISLSPFAIYRFPDAGTPETVWITGLDARNIATEYSGPIVHDGVPEDGASISTVVWDNGVVNWGLYQTAPVEGTWPAPEAAWFTGGGMTDLTFPVAPPTSAALPGGGAMLPSFKSAGYVDIAFPGSGSGLSTALANGLRFFAPAIVQRCYLGRNTGQASCLIVPFVLAGAASVSRGELLTNLNELGAQKYAGSGRVIGVAAHNAAQNDIVHAVKTGNDSDTLVKNTSGVTISAYALVKPHASGGVAAASGMTDGQIIGRTVVSIIDGATGQAELFV